MAGEGFKVVINNDGEVRIEAVGFVGNKCILETEKILKKLKDLGVDIDVEDTVLKEEYYRVEHENKNSVQYY